VPTPPVNVVAFADFQAHSLNPVLPPDFPEEPHCSICFEDYDDSDHEAIRIDRPDCQHVFGLSCLNELFSRRGTQQGVNRCPLCRNVWFRSENARPRSGNGRQLDNLMNERTLGTGRDDFINLLTGRAPDLRLNDPTTSRDPYLIRADRRPWVAAWPTERGAAVAPFSLPQSQQSELNEENLAVHQETLARARTRRVPASPEPLFPNRPGYSAGGTTPIPHSAPMEFPPRNQVDPPRFGVSNPPPNPRPSQIRLPSMYDVNRHEPPAYGPYVGPTANMSVLGLSDDDSAGRNVRVSRQSRGPTAFQPRHVTPSIAGDRPSAGERGRGRGRARGRGSNSLTRNRETSPVGRGRGFPHPTAEGSMAGSNTPYLTPSEGFIPLSNTTLQPGGAHSSNPIPSHAHDLSSENETGQAQTAEEIQRTEREIASISLLRRIAEYRENNSDELNLEAISAMERLVLADAPHLAAPLGATAVVQQESSVRLAQSQLQRAWEDYLVTSGGTSRGEEKLENELSGGCFCGRLGTIRVYMKSTDRWPLRREGHIHGYSTLVAREQCLYTCL
jgi:hypothetical protein